MKVVIIGIHGHMGIVFRNLDRCSGVTLEGIAPGCPEEDISKRAAMWQAHYPSLKIYGDYRKMLDEVKPDVAGVGSYYYKNAGITIDLFKRGIHCVSEKPAALTLEELAELKEEYLKSGVEYASMLEMRYSPLFLAAYNALKKGAVGKPLMATAQKTYKLGERSFLFRSRSCFGGTIPFVGIHGIDLILWMMNSPVTEIFARHTREGNSGHGELESCGIVSLVFKNGTFGSANIDFLNPEKALAHGDDRLRIAGDKGVIEVKEGEAKLMTNDAPPVSIKEEPSRFFFPDFLAQIEKKGSCLLSAEDSFVSAEVVLKARRAADEKRVITF
jgi:predicted dehydrogenase